MEISEHKCKCGHTRDMHTHYTRSIYCSLCDCGRFKRARMWLKDLLAA